MSSQVSGVECGHDNAKSRAVCMKPSRGLFLTAHPSNASFDEWNTIDITLLHPRDGSLRIWITGFKY